jgi:hypothetical protein
MPCVSLFGKMSQNDLCHRQSFRVLIGPIGIHFETGTDSKWLPNIRGIANQHMASRRTHSSASASVAFPK